MARRYRWGFAVFFVASVASLALALSARAAGDGRPSDAQVSAAQQTSDLMVNEIVSALFTEFDETTLDNVEHGKQAISLIFNDLNRDMRLIGTFRPLLGGANDRPSDPFELGALRSALGGSAVTSVQRVNDTWYYRRSVPLSNTLHPNCVLCHTAFTADFFNQTHNPGQWVGALVVSVPIRSGM